MNTQRFRVAPHRHIRCDRGAHMPPFVWARSLFMAVVCAIALLQPSILTAATTQVRSGANLQAAIDAAQPGDTLMLEAGATFIGNFVLPAKTGEGIITIRSDAEDRLLPAAGSRMNPSYAALLPKLKSSVADMPSLRTADGAHHWRIMFIEFPATHLSYGEIIRLGDGSAAQKTLAQVPYAIEIDRVYIHGDPLMGQKRGIALNAASVTIRNSYIADIKAVGFDAQAIGGWNGPGPYAIENNYLEASGENFLLGGADPAIPNLVSENVTIRRNHFSRPMEWRSPVIATPSGVTATAGGIGSLAQGVYGYRVVARMPVGGGSTVRSTASSEVSATVTSTGAAVTVNWSAVPGAREYVVYGRTPAASTQNWTVTGTSFIDTGSAGSAGAAPASPGDVWLVKNLLELKNARNVAIEYNIFENNWQQAQSGYAILLTPRNQDGTCTWCVVSDVTFEYNIVRNVAAGINILGWDDVAPSAQTSNIRIRHNLFSKVTKALGGTGWWILVGDAPKNLVVDHNTIDHEGTAIVYAYGGTPSAPKQVTGFQFTNNAARHNEYGVNGADTGFGNDVLTTFFPGAVFKGNWLQGGPANRYPAGNYMAGEFAAAFVNPAGGDYTLSSESVLLNQATDGTHIGADIATLTAATIKVIEGNVSKLQSPTNLRVIK
jgi:hypothetical protein